MKRWTIFALATLVALSACAEAEEGGSANADQGTGNAAQAQDDLRDISKYRLTMDKYDRYLQAQMNIATAMKNMTPAEREAAQAQSDDNDASLDEMVASVEKNDFMVKAVRQAGLSPREYVMVMMATLQAGMASAVLKMRPNDNQDSLANEMQTNPDNIRFVRDNEAELTRKQKEIADKMEQMGLTDGN